MLGGGKSLIQSCRVRKTTIKAHGLWRQVELGLRLGFKPRPVY